MQSRKHYWMTLGAIGLSVSLHGYAQDTNQPTSDSTNTMNTDASASTARWNDNESSRRQSWIPLTSYGYAGANVGATSLNLPGCSPGVYCDDSGNGFKIYTGGMISRVFGVEASYVQLLGVDRNGGDARAKGLNLGLVANLPVTDRVNLFAKVGAIYGWTRTGSSVAGAPNGDNSDLNWSYGAGAQVDLAGNWGVRVDWDVYRMKFASGTTNASLYSVGLVYKF